MEPKFSKVLVCTFLLFLLNLNFPIIMTQAHTNNSPHHLKPYNTKQVSSALDFIKELKGTRKGNSAKGLSQVKKYLSKLGYMNTFINSNNNDDFFDDNLELALKKYQHFFKLKTSGMLDQPTVSQLSRPRCGVPDFPGNNNDHDQTYQEYSIIALNHSFYTFFPGSPKWSKRNLTYSFPGSTIRDRPGIDTAIRDVGNLWASVLPFKFTYTENYDQADIKISFQIRDHGDGNSFDGTGGILAHAFGPPDGRLHFDGDERWIDGVLEATFDLQTVGLHEMGHVLGLGHTMDGGAIMYPYIGSGSRKGLGEDDVNGIRKLYSS